MQLRFAVVEMYPNDGAALRIQHGVPEVVGVHLTETLVPLNLHLALGGDLRLGYRGITLGLILAVDPLLAVFDHEQRRMGVPAMKVMPENSGGNVT